VRFDAGHKRDFFLTEQLADFVEWVSVCPEVEAGMGVPRPALRLVRRDGELRLLEVASGKDHTRRMERHAAARIKELRALDLCGYVLKSRSPSCGRRGVKVYSEGARARRQGTGIYARALIDAYPNLPIEDEGRLSDAKLRSNFIERVFAYRRLRQLFAGRWSNRELVAFHAAHELQLIAHSPAGYRELLELVSALKQTSRTTFRQRYEGLFMGALAKPASRGRNAKVMRRAERQLGKRLDAASGAELGEQIDRYRKGLAPIALPLTLLRKHARRLDVDDLNTQVFLDPDPIDWMLRNRS
jgi:uncharacterized protein YbbK (DUF523 family)/uncharacterized protein YbgA (DUF1722 family)